MVRGVGCFQDTHQFQTVVVYGDSGVESVTLMFLLTNTDIMGTWWTSLVADGTFPGNNLIANILYNAVSSLHQGQSGLIRHCNLHCNFVG